MKVGEDRCYLLFAEISASISEIIEFATPSRTLRVLDFKIQSRAI